ncbi:MAG: hypothetical protein ACK5DE_04140 [Bacteroidota bacterium]|jgi:hypothetical protein
MASNQKQTEKTTEEKVNTLRQDLDAITFKNKQALKIQAIQAGKEKLKDNLAKNRQQRKNSSAKLSSTSKLGKLVTLQD